MILFISLLLLIQTEEVPLKPKEEFEIKLDYQLKQKPISDRFSIDYYDTKEGGLLPYLIIKIKPLKLSDQEAKVKLVDNKDRIVFNRKINLGDELKLEIGYTDDVKDRVTAHEFNLFFLSNQRKEVSKIHILIAEDGTFLVNDEIRGKF